MAAQFNAASLYVGDLDPDVSEAQLFEKFNQVGAVSSIRVCRDHITRRSLGYAYVNFHNQADAERALDTMNYTDIRGKPCRIMWSKRDPSMRKSGKGNIFIKNLDASIDHKALYDTFSAFGNILSCKVAMDKSGQSRGYGFVHFEGEKEAQLAVDKVNGMALAGKEVFVGPFIPRKERGTSSSEHYTNIYVKNVPEDKFTKDDLIKMFEEHGKVTSACLMTKEDGGSKGFGFVNMETHEEAVAAVEAFNNKETEGGKVLVVCRAQKKSEREKFLREKFERLKVERIKRYQGINLYVKNLSEDIDDDRLRAEFETHGTITSAKVMLDDSGRSRGFGFVCFSEPEEATKAVTEMNGKMLGAKPLYVALAMRKEVRRAQLEAAHISRQQTMRIAPGGGPYPQYSQPMFYPGQGGRGYPMYPQQMMRQRWQPAQQQTRYPVGPMGGNAPPGYRQPPRARPGAAPRPGMMQQAPAVRGAGSRVQYSQAARNVEGGKTEGRLTASALADATPQQQKQMLGEKLFPLVQRTQTDSGLAAKITGMLLEIDNPELLSLLETPEALNAKIEEAVEVLKAHAAQ